MAFEKMEEIEAVKRAALIEENGYRFYTLLAAKIRHKDAKAVFKRLAKDEMKHLKTIEKEFFPKAGLGDEITDEELSIEKNVPLAGQPDIFTKRIDIEALVRTIRSARNALITALYAERHSVEFFEGMAIEANAPAARRLYKELAEVEKEHVSILEGLLAKVS
mgnify:CR=1 FL=1